MIEQDTRHIIDCNLINKGWILDINNPQKNVFFESDILRVFDNPKLKKLRIRPDYVLFDNESKTPIGVIEAKAGGKNLDDALDQAMEYADILKAPLMFAMNNGYCKTRHLYENKPLLIDEKEVNELIRQKDALRFIQDKTNSIEITPKHIRVSRQELVSIFKNLNDTLRDEGLSAGLERLNEFANVLFLKLYCENKEDNIWNDLKITSNNFLINTFNNSLKLIEQRYGATVFTELQIKKPETLKDIILRLDRLKFKTIDMDVIGGAFEYFLQQATATSNDLGEYFTPRHITKAIVNLVNPKFKETIYDPFCGTGGFLTESFNYVKENTVIDSEEDKKKLKEETIYGNEITRNARLGKMNMILHGNGHSGVVQHNSLENPADGNFDVVITNMPFAQKITRTNWNEEKKKNEIVNNISPLYYNSLAKNSGDGVCLLHCFKSLKKGGRMALVVPEGVLFRQDLKNVRQFLLENAKLETVISLPRGAFLPYTGVKTSILYFTNCHSGKTQDRVWYYEVKNDGFSLDNHRRAIKENDLKKIDYVDFLKKKYDDSDIQKIGFEAIEFEKIKSNNYNLCGNVYKENVKSSQYPLISINKLCNDGLLIIQKGKMITRATIESGGIPVIAGGQSSPYSHNKATHEGNIITISASGAAGFVWYHSYPIWASDCNVLYSKDETKLLTRYLYYVLHGQQQEIYKLQRGAGQPHVYAEDLKSLQIPFPPLAEQQKIVDELDSIQRSIHRSIHRFKEGIKNLKLAKERIVAKLWQENSNKLTDADKTLPDSARVK